MKSIAFLLFFYFMVFSIGKSQDLKPIQMDAKFPYASENNSIQFQYSYETGISAMNLIHSRKNTDSVIYLQAKLNRYGKVIDSFHINDRLGRKLVEGYYRDTAYTLQTVYTYHSFYYLEGVPHGTFNVYEYSSDDKNAQRFLYTSENFSNGKKQGEFRINYPTSPQVRKISNYSKDQLHGLYSEFHEDGTYIVKGEYKDDLKHGTWIYYQENNKAGLYEQFQEGKLHGQYKQWHLNGNVAVVTNYQEGVMNSFYHSYYSNKQIKDSCTFDNGKLYGKSVSYYENGQKKSVGEYKSGRPISDYKFWDENGQLRQHLPYRFGYLNGTVLKYHANGKISESYGMKNDTLNGEYLTYYPNGKTKTKARYKIGVLQNGAQYFDSTGKKMNYGEESIEEVLPPEPVEEMEQIDWVQEGLILVPAELKWVRPTAKNDLKIYKKIKDKTIKVQIQKDGSYTLIFPEDFSSKMITSSREMITRHLSAKNFHLNGQPIACTVSFIIE